MELKNLHVFSVEQKKLEKLNLLVNTYGILKNKQQLKQQLVHMKVKLVLLVTDMMNVVL
jgi:hypothetical protein